MPKKMTPPCSVPDGGLGAFSVVRACVRALQSKPQLSVMRCEKGPPHADHHHHHHQGTVQMR